MDEDGTKLKNNNKIKELWSNFDHWVTISIHNYCSCHYSAGLRMSSDTQRCQTSRFRNSRFFIQNFNVPHFADNWPDTKV